MAEQYIGMNSPSPSSSTGTTTKTFIMGSDLFVGDHIYTTFNIPNTAGNYKVGKITMSTTWPSNILARYRNNDSTITNSQTISDDRSFSFYVNWLSTDTTWLFFDFQEPGPGGSYEVSITWEAVTNHLATYSTDTPYTYTGTSITGIYNCSGCSVAGGTNTATNVGSYAVTLTANSLTKYSNAYYFASSATGVASTYKDVTWQIVANTDKYVSIYHNGAWGRYIPYIYTNGSWHKAVAYVYTNNQWKEVNS